MTRDEATEWSEFRPSPELGHIAAKREAEHEMTMSLLREIGFCRVMKMAQAGWAEQLESMIGVSGGEFIVGPCVGMTVDCKHEIVDKNGNCDMCAGSGWITQGVQNLIDERNNVIELAQDVVDSEDAVNAVLDILNLIADN
jgi:hypothetical protein